MNGVGVVCILFFPLQNRILPVYRNGTHLRLGLHLGARHGRGHAHLLLQDLLVALLAPQAIQVVARAHDETFVGMGKIFIGQDLCMMKPS